MFWAYARDLISPFLSLGFFFVLGITRINFR